MQFTDQDVDAVRTAIKGLGADKVYALAMALSDGTVQVEIFKLADDNLQAIALSGHPYYTRNWRDVTEFLDRCFTDRPNHVMRVSDFAGFNQSMLLASI